MRAKCNKDLFLAPGTEGETKCFTKGRSYHIIYQSDEKMILIDDDGAQHSVWKSTQSITGGWMEHFKLIQKKNGSKKA